MPSRFDEFLLRCDKACDTSCHMNHDPHGILPAALLRILADCLPKRAADTDLQRLIQQQLVPVYDPTFQEPLYEDFLKLRMRGIAGDDVRTIRSSLSRLHEHVRHKRYDIEIAATELSQITVYEKLQSDISAFNEELLEHAPDRVTAKAARMDAKAVAKSLEIPQPLQRLLRDRLRDDVDVPGFWEGVEQHVLPHFVDDGFLADKSYQTYLVMKAQADVLGFGLADLDRPVRNQLTQVEAKIAMTGSRDDTQALMRHMEMTRGKFMDLLRDISQRDAGHDGSARGGSQRR